ncbi:hypothetical protein MFUL124B02_17740 [Myxococcus fulvus 124B02]|nr:hypothetical protein MFUL124B02_17740 [Myxococcus fulvus 124B02]
MSTAPLGEVPQRPTNNEDTLEAVPDGWCFNGRPFGSGATIDIGPGDTIDLEAAPSLLRPTFYLDGRQVQTPIRPPSGRHSIECRYTENGGETAGDITGTLNVGTGTDDSRQSRNA